MKRLVGSVSRSYGPMKVPFFRLVCRYLVIGLSLLAVPRCKTRQFCGLRLLPSRNRFLAFTIIHNKMTKKQVVVVIFFLESPLLRKAGISLPSIRPAGNSLKPGSHL